MKTSNKWVLAMLVAVVAAGMAIVGCESTQTSENILTVSPTVAHINSGRGAGIAFSISTAIGDSTISSSSSNSTGTTTSTTTMSTNQVVHYPLIWSVSDSSLGEIASSEGDIAFYVVKGGEGNNIVRVRDQGDNKGEAVVAQRSTY